MNKLNMFEQVEQVLTDALRCSDVGTTDLEQVVLPLDAKRVSRSYTHHLTELVASNQVAVREDCRESEGVLGRQFHRTGNEC